MIDRAEQFLRAQGFPTVRVRYHKGDLARIEVPMADLHAAACRKSCGPSVTDRLQQLGFKFVTLDLMGFRSGSLNVLVPVENWRRPLLSFATRLVVINGQYGPYCDRDYSLSAPVRTT